MPWPSNHAPPQCGFQEQLRFWELAAIAASLKLVANGRAAVQGRVSESRAVLKSGTLPHPPAQASEVRLETPSSRGYKMSQALRGLRPVWNAPRRFSHSLQLAACRCSGPVGSGDPWEVARSWILRTSRCDRCTTGAGRSEPEVLPEQPGPGLQDQSNLSHGEGGEDG